MGFLFPSPLDSWIETAKAADPYRGNAVLPRQHQSDYQRIGIIGGGAAGYLSALAFRKLRPELDVTVIESDAIPPIGVGESTTAEIVSFLHGILGLDIEEFHREVKPTWKLGILFEWGKPGDYVSYSPFDRGRLLEAKIYDGDLANHNLNSILMNQRKAPILNLGHDFRSMLPDVGFGYHVDNHRLIRYLRQQLSKAGVTHLARTIKDVRLKKDGEEVDILEDTEGDQHRFDLYIDCTGFRSLVMGDALRSPFIDFSESLFTDCALATNSPHDGRIDSYTTASTMENGWSWKIPQLENDHRGYVFSTRFATPDEAEAEFRKRYPGIGDVRVIPFRSGRREHFWKGNVVAIGNAYGFVEPLQSTALSAAFLMATFVARRLPTSKNNVLVRSRLNDLVARMWDSLRWFLAVHFRFNRRSDSEFWKACQNDADISGAEYIIDLFQKQAPLSFQTGYSSDEFVPAFVYDQVLIGFDVPTTPGPLTESPDQYQYRKSVMHQLSELAMSGKDALNLVINHRPDLLRSLVTRPDSWIRMNAQALLKSADNS